jgi:hypothetical protein
MKRLYTCPHCEGVLNPNVKIILAAASGATRGLLLLSPTPGNYDMIVSRGLSLDEGALVDLRCPICQASLHSALDDNLAEVCFRLDNGTHGRVDFSRRVGEHATYVISRETIRSYGDQAPRYSGVNFFMGTSHDD